ncbi:hypothetical protein [Chromobacterium subtsugae]|uniref:hypothetical protein n=1 Tax=Chromobacterium subtsugae TaxID=251747 RepID=UPI000A969F43|nr:hypothetical protein [Chromobacterium subtsugae]
MGQLNFELLPFVKKCFALPLDWTAISGFATAVGAVFALIAAFAALWSASIAGKTIRESRRLQEEEVSCADAKECLQKAFHILMEGADPETGKPKASRTNWLIAARLILRFEEIEKSITLPAYKKVLNGQRMLWSSSFRDVLRCIDKPEDNEIGYGLCPDPTYFNQGGFERKIEKSSAVVLMSFSVWDGKVVDPLRGVDVKKDFPEGHCVFDMYPSLKLFVHEKL